MIKVLIADDQELIRESLKIVLSSDEKIEVCDTVADGRAVLESIKKDKPDVILMDIRMPEMDGVQCTKIIKEAHPDIKIIVLTTFDDDEYIFDALKYGASGYLLKGVSMKELISGIYTVAGGGAMINPDVAGKVVKLFSKLAKGGLGIKVNKKNIESIGKTEWKVIMQIGRGLSNKEIAKVLYLSEGTVRNYLSQILNKLDLRDRTQLAIWAVETGVTYGKLVDEDEQ
ncbi:MAG: response regulator transcription factor [Clostridium sp.]|nr:response regulator transcription factor [Clostridium sp.]